MISYMLYLFSVLSFYPTASGVGLTHAERCLVACNLHLNPHLCHQDSSRKPYPLCSLPIHTPLPCPFLFEYTYLLILDSLYANITSCVLLTNWARLFLALLRDKYKIIARDNLFYRRAGVQNLSKSYPSADESGRRKFTYLASSQVNTTRLKQTSNAMDFPNSRQNHLLLRNSLPSFPPCLSCSLLRILHFTHPFPFTLCP